MQYSYLLSQKLFTVLIIGSLIALTSIAYAQEELSDGEVNEVLEETSLTIVGEALVTEITDGNMSFQIEVANETSDQVSFTYSAEVRTIEGGGLVDIGGGANTATLEAKDSQILTFTYVVPTWLSGKYDVFVTLYANDGVLTTGLVDTIMFTGTRPEIEILSDTCVFNEKDNNKLPLSEELTTSEDSALVITCMVRNNTDSEKTTTPTITAFTPIVTGTEVGSQKGEQLVLLAGEIQETTFALMPLKVDGSYSVRLGLDTDNSNTVVAENLMNALNLEKDIQATQSASPEERNTVLYVVVTLLALMTLLAILVYQRKTTLPATTMHNPEK